MKCRFFAHQMNYLENNAMKHTKETETTDEVVQETRKIKEDLAKSMDFNIDRILKDATRKQKEGGRKLLSPPIRQKA